MMYVDDEKMKMILGGKMVIPSGKRGKGGRKRRGHCGLGGRARVRDRRPEKISKN